MQLPAPVTQLAQFALKAQGFDPGRIDGHWGRRTQAAYDRYVAANARPVASSPILPRAGEAFAAWFSRQGIRHFTPAEVLFRGHTDARLRLNTDPPRPLWPHIIPTLRLLDRLCDDLSIRIHLTSIYRSSAYNLRIGSSNPADPTILTGKGSQHPRFSATDIQSPDASPATLHAALLRLRRAGVFRGGLGRYSTFVHVDTRGYNADWTGS